MKRRAFQLSMAFAAIGLSTSAFAQAKWDLATAYPASNFHTVNINQFVADVDKASGGKLKITVHPNAALFKAPEIKRAVQGGQAQAGEILLVNYQNEWQLFGARMACRSWPTATTRPPSCGRRSARCWRRSWPSRA